MYEEVRTSKPRIWLDATREDDADADADGLRFKRPATPPAPAPISAPVPPLPIPPRHALLPASPAGELRPRPHSLNHGRAKRKEKEKPPPPPSPEVISSLISSLRTIPDPADKLAASGAYTNGSAKSSPVLPTVRPMRSFGASTDFVDRNAEFRALQSSLLRDLADLDDAAEPPVIRTSKRPPGHSEWKTIKAKKENGNNLRAYLKAGIMSRSASSLASNGHDDLNIDDMNGHSLDRWEPVQNHIDHVRSSLESRSSIRKGYQSLYHPGSREQIVAVEKDWFKDPVAAGAIAAQEYLYSTRPKAQPSNQTSKRPHPFDAPLGEMQPPVSPISRVPQRESSKKKGKKPVLEAVALPVTTLSPGPAVPSRRSSLRTQDIPASPQHWPHSREGSGQFYVVDTVPEVKEPQSRPQTQPVLEQSSAIAEAPQTEPLASQPVFDEDDNQTTRRIKELKARKEERDKLARESLTTESDGISESFVGPANAWLRDSWDHARASPNEEPLVRPEIRGFTGTTVNVCPPEILVETKDEVKPADWDYLGSDDQPGRPLTPMMLPINYSHVLRSLGQESPPSSKAPSTVESTRSTNGVRPKSMSAGRAANSRRDGSKSLLPDMFSRRQSETNSSPTLDQASDRGTVLSTGKKSIDSTTPSVSSGNMKRSNSSKKKRWSHPDLPASFERRGSLFESKYAVKSPDRPETVVEEPRPATTDSVELAVNAFINAPRLSQKVAHLETGRIISFSEVGDPDGHVVFCCVGMGLTRYVMAFYDELATTLKLRLITPDRPGVGESHADPAGKPLSWPDDIVAICQALQIERFSIMAHSAGAIYALATALKLPRNIRGKIHLLAPWIPPSQMAPVGSHPVESPPGASLPRAQRFLRVLPAPLLKVANSGFLGTASVSLYPNGNVKPAKKLRKSIVNTRESPPPTLDSPSHDRRESFMLMDQQNMPNGSTFALPLADAGLNGHSMPPPPTPGALAREAALAEAAAEARRASYDERLTLAIWDKATTNANPAVDLIVCLERNQDIGFRYADVTRAVVIHHGAKDSRVPAENVKWLGRTMKRCEVRILVGEGHGLMASAGVMAKVLGEMSAEWEEWDRAITGGGSPPAPANELPHPLDRQWSSS